MNERAQPHDHGAEQYVLGGMLLSTDAIDDTLDVLTRTDLYRPAHATIYDTILRLYGEGHPITPVSVAAALADTGDLARIGGADYLHTLIAATPGPAQARYYACIVAERALQRRLVETGIAISQLGHHGPAHADDNLADRASQLLYQAVAARTTSDLHQVGALIPAALDAIEEAGKHTGLRGASAGLLDLDHHLGGLRPGQLVIVAARPAVGKSVLGVQMARAIALRDRQPCIFFSLEMGREELMARILAAECSIPLDSLLTGHLDDNEWIRIGQRAGEISEAPLYIDDTAGVSLLDIRAKARRLAARGPIAAIIVDYLQLMTSAKSRDSREREVAELSRGLKLLARELQIPVVTIAQVNRASELRADKRPHLSDLRESGAIEADADVVLLLHRPDYQDKNNERRGEVDIDVAKNRNGPTGSITAAAQLHYARFVNISL